MNDEPDTDLPDPTHRGTCVTCGVEIAQWEALGVRWPSHCSGCEPRVANEAVRRAQEREREERLTTVRRVFPVLYQEIARACRKDFPELAWGEISRWDPAGMDGLFRGHGLLIAGKSGGFKSTMACAAVGNLHLRTGLSIGYLSVPEFETTMRLAWSGTDDEKKESRLLLKAARTARLLVLDDLGKETTMPQIEAELFSLLNHRCEKMRPTVTTMNTSREEYEARLSSDRSAPMIRRLQEYNRFILVE